MSNPPKLTPEHIKAIASAMKGWLAGCRCESCGRAMLFVVKHDSEKSTIHREDIEQALWSIGACEYADGVWRCWKCSRESPSLALRADEERETRTRIDLRGIRQADIEAWRRR